MSHGLFIGAVTLPMRHAVPFSMYLPRRYSRRQVTLEVVPPHVVRPRRGLKARRRIAFLRGVARVQQRRLRTSRCSLLRRGFRFPGQPKHVAPSRPPPPEALRVGARNVTDGRPRLRNADLAAVRVPAGIGCRPARQRGTLVRVSVYQQVPAAPAGLHSSSVA